MRRGGPSGGICCIGPVVLIWEILDNCYNYLRRSMGFTASLDTAAASPFFFSSTAAVEARLSNEAGIDSRDDLILFPISESC